jgi:hypothetical protein
MISKARLMSLSASILVLSSASFASDDFNQGSLQITGGSLQLKGAQGNATLASGDAQITVSGAGLFGAGYLKIRTNGTEVNVTIPRKAYTGGENFMAYSTDSGQKYNIRGSNSSDVQKDPPTQKQQNCTFPGIELDTSIDVSSLVAPCPCTITDANGTVSTPQPVQNIQTVKTYVCEWGASQAGAKSEIKVTDSGNCTGSNIERSQLVTTTNKYKLEFFDPAQPSAPVATFEGSATPQTFNQDLGAVTACK